MPVPTISAVTPNVGPTLGGNYIEITGSNFQLPIPVLVPGQVTAMPPPSYRVYIGGTEVLWKNIIAFSDSRIGVKVPPSGVMARTASSVAVDVTVENIATSGLLIPGETVTSSGAYTYQRMDISGQNKGALAILINSLGRRISTDVVPNTVFSTHPDWDRDTSTVFIDGSTLPAIFLMGPALVRDSLYDDGSSYVYEDELPNPTEYFEQRPARAYSVVFEIMGIADNAIVSTNMMEVFHQWMERIDKITYTDLMGDEVSLDIRYAQGGEPTWMDPTQAHRDSGNRAWSSQVVLRGFKSRQLAGVQYDMVYGISHELLTINLQEVGQLLDNSGSRAPVSPGSGSISYQIPPAPGSPGGSTPGGTGTPPAPVSPGP